MEELIAGCFTLLGALLAIFGGFWQGWYNRRHEDKRYERERRERQEEERAVYLRERKELAYRKLIHQMRASLNHNDQLTFLQECEADDDIMELFASEDVILAVNDFRQISENIVRCRERETDYGEMFDSLIDAYSRARECMKADLLK